MECRHCAVCAPARLIELGIADFEFLHFLFGIGVGFCNAYAGDTAFDGGVYHGIALAAVGKRFAHLAAQAQGNEQQHRNAGKYDKRQPHVYHAEVNERAYYHYRADDKIFGTVVRQFANVKQVARESGHYFAGLVIVIEGEGQPLKVRKHIAAHLRLHCGAYHVSVVLDKITKHKAKHVKSEHDKSGVYHAAEVFVGDEVVQHTPRDYGVHHAYHRDKERGKHIHCKHEFVRLVVCDKAFQHDDFFGIPSCFIISVRRLPARGAVLQGQRCVRVPHASRRTA